MSAAPNALPANALRGEAVVAGHRLRPSFAALVAAEAELGPLFALVERAAAGGLTLAEVAALCWHCLAERPAGLTRDDFGAALADAGLAAIAPPLGVLLGQIMHGHDVPRG